MNSFNTKAAVQALIPLDDRDGWTAALRDIPHAFGHGWASCRAFALSSGLPTYLYSYVSDRARVAVPLAERRHRGTVDVVTPYGASGFAAAGQDPRFTAAWHDFAAGCGWVCGYILQHPLIEPPEAFVRDGRMSVRRAHVLDLSLDTGELRRRLSQNRRRQLRNWAETAARFTSDRQAMLAFILAERDGFFRERGAADVYAFADETWQALLALPNAEVIGTVEEGRVVAASVFAWEGPYGEYLFNISRTEGRDASVPLIWEAALRLKARGVLSLNLGGGVREGDGVERFKERFGADIHPFMAFRQVYNAERFEALCAAAGTSPSAEGYFPPYRAGTG